MSCSNASKNIKPEDEKVSPSTEAIKEKVNYNDKLIKRYETQGINLTAEQKEKINKLISSSDTSGQTKGNRNSVKREIRKNIEQNILTAEQRALIKKKGN
tara:strand:- start:130 stop:429 length:300 start_codon:yes stop_codon:yes gene_type:complete